MKSFLLFTLLLTLVYPVHSYAEDTGSHEFDPAFTHVVYFWLNNPDNEADRSKFEAAVKQFMEDSKYAKTRFVGVPPKATREVVDDSFTYSLILSFESAEAQEKYQAEPAHAAFVESCKDLWAKVIVYDSMLLPSDGNGR
ncbi:MAG: Dabb family protein [Opitutales bacterium]